MTVLQIIEKTKQFGQAVSTFCSERNKAVLDNTAEREHILHEQQSEAAIVSAAWQSVTSEFQREIDRRNSSVEHALSSVNDELNNINDPHWHRMKAKYYDWAKDNVSADYTDQGADALLANLETLLRQMFRETQKIRNAFISPGMANVMGHVIKGYRKKIYRRLASTREQILRCSEAIIRLADIDEKNNLAITVKDSKAAVIAEKAEQSLGELPSKLQNRLEYMKEVFTRIAHTIFDEGMFGVRDIYLGQLDICENEEGITDLLPGELINGISGTWASFPLYASQIDGNIFFACDENSNLTNYFSSIALDLIKKDPNVSIFFADLVGIGSNYTLLSKPCEKGRVTIWHNEAELLQGLEKLCNTISDTYSSVLGDSYESLDSYNETHHAGEKPYTYLFIDTINENIPERAWGYLRRIIDNGRQVGVRLIVSVNSNYSFPHQIQDNICNLINHSHVLSVAENRIGITSGVEVSLPYEINREKIVAACSRIDSMNDSNSVISLGSYLPKSGDWQLKSSEKSIELRVGIDKYGNEHALVLSEDKPYALVIGDVDTGKSSLLHTVAIQTMANYSAAEVSIAVGDFKDGAEFNIYAASRLPSIEAVVDNEDPDVMASFLRYYVKQMHVRQRMFERMESRTNRLVRKYETYREVCREFGFVEHGMPRILLIIDEYQSLFENVQGTASLLSELVRKGRTYGIHIIMASQRAVSDNPRNTFTGDLKNYFTSRFVFKSPQTAARTMLSERCADTGKENTGISKAVLLKRGQTIYNSYMGQTEKDNNELQCFYADDALISKACRALIMMNGNGNSILLKKDAELPLYPYSNESDITLGVSPCLHNDCGEAGTDDIRDDTTVSVHMEETGKNIVCTGSDDRVSFSAAMSAYRYAQNNYECCKLHIFGDKDNKLAKRITDVYPTAHFHSGPEMRDELSRQAEKDEYCVNVFVEITDNNEYSQSLSGLRVSPESELLKNFLSNPKALNLIQSKSYKNIKSNFPYITGAASVYLMSAGDSENIRSVASENYRVSESDFDIPQNNTINAYYYNKKSGKFGKVIMYPM